MPALSSTTFGTQLKNYRHRRHLTQGELGNAAGYKPISISKMERGERVPRKVNVLARALKLTPEEEEAFQSAADAAAYELGQLRRAQRNALAVAPQRTPLRRPMPPTVGRAIELALLDDHLSHNGPPMLIFAGTPGIGKTHLLRETLERGEVRQMTVLHGGCRRQSGQLPYAPITGTLKRFMEKRTLLQQRQDLRGCGWLALLLPEIERQVPKPGWPLEPEQNRRLMFDAVKRYLLNVAGPSGTLLVFDDLQWIGNDALSLLDDLIRWATEQPVRIVVAFRDTEANEALHDFLTDICHDGLAQLAPLPPLSPSEAQTLLALLVPEMSSEQQHATIARAEGIPFFLRGLSKGMDVQSHAGITTAGNVADNLAVFVHHWVASVSPDAKTLLSIIAVAGRETPRTILQFIAGQHALTDRALLTALEALSHAGLIVEHDTVVEFIHDIVREIVASGLSTTRRALFHYQIAMALEREIGEPPIALLAYHFSQSDHPERALTYLEKAGDAALAMYANAEAEHHYRQLIDLLHHLGDDTQELHIREKYAAALAQRAPYDRALDELSQIAEEYRRRRNNEGWLRATAQSIRLHAFRGTPEHDDDRVRILLDLWETDELRNSTSTLDLAAALGFHFYMTGRYAAAYIVTERAVRFARDAGQDRLLMEIEWMYGYGLLGIGKTGEALLIAEKVIPQAEACDAFDTLCEALHLAVLIHERAGNLAISCSLAKRALVSAERTGNPIWVGFINASCGQDAFYRGDWDEARLHVRRALRANREMRLDRVTMFALIEQGRLSLAKGAHAAARRQLDWSIATAARYQELIPLRYAQALRAEGEMLTGDAHAARERLLPLFVNHDLAEWGMQGMIPILAWAEVALGHYDAAQALIMRGEDSLRRRGQWLILVEVLAVKALLATQQGWWDEAAIALHESLNHARRIPYPYGEIKALSVAGFYHAQHHEPDAARAHWRQAQEQCRRLGERSYAVLIRRELLSLGG